MLTLGSRGDDVSRLQRQINEWRVAQGLAPIDVDGRYGADTYEAVSQFQQALLGRSDGIYGEETGAALGAALTIRQQGVVGEPTPSDNGGSGPSEFLASIPEAITNFLAPQAAAASPTQPGRVVDSPFMRTAPDVRVGPGPRSEQIWPADIIEMEEFPEVLRRAGMRPEQQRELSNHLTEVARALGGLDPSVRGAAVMTVREMYLRGELVTIDSRYPVESGTNTLSLHVRAVDGRSRFGGQREVDGLADPYGLHAEVFNDRSLRLSVDMDYTDLEELRLDLENANGGRITAITPVQTSGCGQTSGFGLRRDPFHGGRSNHQGIDFGHGGNSRVPIVAAMPGRVVMVGDRRNGYGNQIVIEDIYGVRHRYAHLASMSVEVGDIIQQGTEIGIMGMTGRSTGVHLHYEQFVVQRNRYGFSSERRLNPNEGENALPSAEAGTAERREQETPVRPLPRQLAQAAERVVERQVARVERQLAAAEAARQEMVQSVVDVSSQVFEGAANLAQNALSGARNLFSRG